MNTPLENTTSTRLLDVNEPASSATTQLPPSPTNNNPPSIKRSNSTISRRQSLIIKNSNKKEPPSFFQKHIIGFFKRFYRFLRSANYIVFLLSFTSFSCLLFAVILIIINPQVQDIKNHYHSSASSPNSNSDATTTAPTTSTYLPSSTTLTTLVLTNNSTTSPSSYPRISLSFLDALFMSVSAFTASGLNTVYYFDWGVGCYILFGLEMTLGSIVLLTMLPAILRYRPLAAERRKLIDILEATGAYGHFLEHVVDEKFGAPVSPANSSNDESHKNVQNDSTASSSSSSSLQNPLHEAAQIKKNENASFDGGPMTRKSATSLLSNNTSFSPVGTGKVMTERDRSTAILAYGKAASVSLSSPLMAPSNSNTLASNVTNNNKKESVINLERPLSPAVAGASSVENNNKPTSPVFTKEEIEHEKNMPATTLTFGQRIVYEDGLAHVNQQIDICLIIIFGCLFYWFAIHFLFTIFILCSGANFGWTVFSVISAFNNAGFAISPQSMIPIDTQTFVMVMLTFVMALGNSLFPLMFRLMLTFVHWFFGKISGVSTTSSTTSSSNTNDDYKEMENTAPNMTGKAPVFLLGQPILVWQHSLRLFLRYPRRYYTHMFSMRTSLILFGVWSFMTILGCTLLGPELDQDGLLPSKPERSHAFFIALFQSVSVRTTGFAIVDISRVTSGHLCWWVFAFLFAAYPGIIVIRSSSTTKKKSSSSANKDAGDGNSNMPLLQSDDDDDDDDDKSSSSSSDSDDEEALNMTIGSLGDENSLLQNSSSGNLEVAATTKNENSELYDDDGDDEDHDDKYLKQTTAKKEIKKKESSVKRLATDQLARDLFWLYLAITLIMYFEHTPIPDSSEDHDYALYLRVVFEVASAFGNVGLSIGRLPGLSFSGSFTSGFSSFVIILVMFFGKHRFLPKSVDEAIAIKIRKYDFSSDEMNPEKFGSGSWVNLNDNGGNDDDENENDDNNNDNGHFSSSNKKRVRRAASISRARLNFYTRKVTMFYRHYNPARVPQVDRIITAFDSNPKAVLRNLIATYGPMPKSN